LPAHLRVANQVQSEPTRARILVVPTKWRAVLVVVRWLAVAIGVGLTTFCFVRLV